MSDNCQFAFAVHVLSVLALRADAPTTSDDLAHSVNTNAVVIRRLLSQLSEAGLVESQRGPGGGTRLAKSPQDITLAQIYRASSGEIAPFGSHPNTPAQCCAVGKSIGRVLEVVAQRARDAVEREYEKTSLADVVKAVQS